MVNMELIGNFVRYALETLDEKYIELLKILILQEIDYSSHDTETIELRSFYTNLLMYHTSQWIERVPKLPQKSMNPKARHIIEQEIIHPISKFSGRVAKPVTTADEHRRIDLKQRGLLIRPLRNS